MRLTWFKPHGNFCTYRSKALPVFQFFSVCALVITYVAFVLSLFVLSLFFLQCCGKAVIHDCGIS